MTKEFTYEATLRAAARARWDLDDVVGEGRALDFGRPFLPETLARTSELPFLAPEERRTLNHIRGLGYLHLFGVVEAFILPFVLDHARPSLHGEDARVRALLEFAAEEAKHIHLFKRFRSDFEAGFGHTCDLIGPAHEVSRAVLAHHPLAVALVILHVEWMTQRHYLDSVHDDDRLDAHFKSLLRFHWMEEAQHAKLDTLMVEELADACSPAEIEEAVVGYLDILAFIDAGLGQQVEFDLAGFERATGHVLTKRERERFVAAQRQANRWTFIGSGMTHPRFRTSLDRLGNAARERIETVAARYV